MKKPYGAALVAALCMLAAQNAVAQVSVQTPADATSGGARATVGIAASSSNPSSNPPSQIASAGNGATPWTMYFTGQSRTVYEYRCRDKNSASPASDITSYNLALFSTSLSRLLNATQPGYGTALSSTLTCFAQPRSAITFSIDSFGAVTASAVDYPNMNGSATSRAVSMEVFPSQMNGNMPLLLAGSNGADSSFTNTVGQLMPVYRQSTVAIANVNSPMVPTSFMYSLESVVGGTDVVYFRPNGSSMDGATAPTSSAQLNTYLYFDRGYVNGNTADQLTSIAGSMVANRGMTNGNLSVGSSAANCKTAAAISYTSPVNNTAGGSAVTAVGTGTPAPSSLTGRATNDYAMSSGPVKMAHFAGPSC